MSDINAGRVNFLGLKFHNLTFEEAMRRLNEEGSIPEDILGETCEILGTSLGEVKRAIKRYRLLS